jgi:hypothetical protein
VCYKSVTVHEACKHVPKLLITPCSTHLLELGERLSKTGQTKAKAKAKRRHLFITFVRIALGGRAALFLQSEAFGSGETIVPLEQEGKWARGFIVVGVIACCVTL